MRRITLRNWIAAAAIFAVCFLIFASGILRPLDNIFADWLYQTPRNINNDIKIIAVDEKTLAELGTFGSWDRQIYADLIQALTAEDASPAVVGFDIMFVGEISPEGDAAFAKAAAQHKNVCVASHIVFQDRLVQEEGGARLDRMSVSMMEMPYAQLAAVTQAGFANMAAEQDGIVRSSTMTAAYGEQQLYSFAAVCYQAYMQARGMDASFPPTDERSRWWIPYAGYPGDYEVISLVDVLNGKINPKLFDGALVLVGAYAPGLQDAYSVPIEKSQQMYGVEIHANIIQAMLDGVSALPVNTMLAALIAAAGAAVLYLLFCRIKKAWLSLILLAGCIVINVLAGYLLYQNGLMIHLVYFPLAAIGVYVATLVSHYLFELAHRKKVINAFKKYVAPQVVEELVRKGQYEISLGGENRDIAVMFVDIRGFTPLSERLKPEEVVEILNSYLNLTTESIFHNGGTLDKFIGDATMAIFNAPFDLDHYELRAAKTALDIVAGAAALEAELEERCHESVGFGLGLHCGEAVVGNIGCINRMDYTAIGDTVNTAARLESRAARSQILMSEAFYLRVKDEVEAREIGTMPLKGKTAELNVYELLRIK